MIVACGADTLIQIKSENGKSLEGRIRRNSVYSMVGSRRATRPIFALGAIFADDAASNERFDTLDFRGVETNGIVGPSSAPPVIRPRSAILHKSIVFWPGRGRRRVGH